MQKITPYNELNEVIELLSEKVSDVLSENLIGLYLTGSLSYGDFVLGRSDLDFQAVVKRQLSHEELGQVEQLHIDIENAHPEWRGRIEGSYLPVKFLDETHPPVVPRSWWGDGKFHAEVLYDNQWIINQYHLYNHGVALSGPDYMTLAKPIDIVEVQKACAKDLFQEWEPKIRDLEWFDDPHYQSYLVLNLCRILHTIMNSEAASKRVSAESVQKKYPEWKNLIEEAENWEFGMEMKRREDVIAFIRFAIEKVEEKNLI